MRSWSKYCLLKMLFAILPLCLIIVAQSPALLLIETMAEKFHVDAAKKQYCCRSSKGAWPKCLSPHCDRFASRWNHPQWEQWKDYCCKTCCTSPGEHDPNWCWLECKRQRDTCHCAAVDGDYVPAKKPRHTKKEPDNIEDELPNYTEVELLDIPWINDGADGSFAWKTSWLPHYQNATLVTTVVVKTVPCVKLHKGAPCVWPV